MRPPSQAIDHFRTSHFLRAPPGIKIAVPLQGQAMLFDPHVTHLHFPDELIDRHPFRSFEGIQNLEPLGAAYFSKHSLIHGSGRLAAVYTRGSSKYNTKFYASIRNGGN